MYTHTQKKKTIYALNHRRLFTEELDLRDNEISSEVREHLKKHGDFLGPGFPKGYLIVHQLILQKANHSYFVVVLHMC